MDPPSDVFLVVEDDDEVAMSDESLSQVMNRAASSVVLQHKRKRHHTTLGERLTLEAEKLRESTAKCDEWARKHAALQQDNAILAARLDAANAQIARDAARIARGDAYVERLEARERRRPEDHPLRCADEQLRKKDAELVGLRIQLAKATTPAAELASLRAQVQTLEERAAGTRCLVSRVTAVRDRLADLFVDPETRNPIAAPVVVTRCGGFQSKARWEAAGGGTYDAYARANAGSREATRLCPKAVADIGEVHKAVAELRAMLRDAGS